MSASHTTWDEVGWELVWIKLKDTFQEILIQ